MTRGFRSFDRCGFWNVDRGFVVYGKQRRFDRFGWPVNLGIDTFKPRHSQDDRMIADRRDKERIFLRNVGDVIPKSDLTSRVGEYPAVGKGDLGSRTRGCF